MTTADAAWAEIQAFVREVRTPNPCPPSTDTSPASSHGRWQKIPF